MRPATSSLPPLGIQVGVRTVREGKPKVIREFEDMWIRALELEGKNAGASV